MSKLISQVALSLIAVSGVEISALALASPAAAQNASSPTGWTLNCSDGICRNQRIASSFATTPAPKSIPENNPVMAILVVGLGMLLYNKKPKSSQAE
ncbi:hypothetical protein [Microcoleus sp. FACHB-68]|uniref:hypothetical protein n=1 Tax=Microcoleus sp. FACHB-68 TaxID=2692826 RepID=UPI0016852C49|nr:hypothetical protein [Microcoleus sp. FACHB-68]MBD1940584.1 hypothetical protein [Microcoleus sp. FACHB-68]